MLSVLTNNEFVGVSHAVINHKDPSIGRISKVFFCSPKLDTVVMPLNLLKEHLLKVNDIKLKQTLQKAEIPERFPREPVKYIDLIENND